jgi:hypothetical protein
MRIGTVWTTIRARLPWRHREERVVGVGEVAWLMRGETWRAVTREERPDLFFEPEVCRGCGCTDERACPGGCFWVGRGLCSRCVAGFGGTD